MTEDGERKEACRRLVVNVQSGRAVRIRKSKNLRSSIALEPRYRPHPCLPYQSGIQRQGFKHISGSLLVFIDVFDQANFLSCGPQAFHVSGTEHDCSQTHMWMNVAG
nr:hypothetical protein CFP56_30848 [Quercus suber]